MTPAPSAGGEASRKRRRRRRPTKPPTPLNDSSGTSSTSSDSTHHPARSAQAGGEKSGGQANRNQKQPQKRSGSNRPKPPYAKRVDEVSAGGLVIDSTGTKGLLIGRKDLKDASKERLLWSLPKGHIEAGETPEQAAIREVAEETGIHSEISRELGVIDFWFMAGGKRIHKTVHHFLFRELGGELAPQVTEVDEVGWFPLEEIIALLAYPDEKKLIARSGELKV